MIETTLLELDSVLDALEGSQLTEPIKLNISYADENFPVLISLSQSFSDRLLVTYNGAVDRSRCEDGIVFQRSSWLEDLEASVVSFADPTLLAQPGLAIGWGQLNPQNFAPVIYLKILEVLRRRLGLPTADRTVHFGSSAGGFQAVCAATLDKGSRVLANNPQLDWSLYGLKWQVRKVKEQVLMDTESEGGLCEREPWRIRVWELFKKEGHAPHMRVLVNSASENDFEVQIPAFLDALNSLNFLSSQWRFEYVLYRNEALGHGPLGKGTTEAEINSSLKAVAK